MNFLTSLLSRKLIVTIAGSVYFASIGDVNQALALVLGYLGIQGAIDIFKK